MPATSSTVQDPAHDTAGNAARLRAKTRLFTGIVIVSNVSGNSALTHGMKLLGDTGNSPLALIGALFHPWVALGVALLILWTLTMMALLSWADLSYVLPVTAAGYVLAAIAGRVLAPNDKLRKLVVIDPPSICKVICSCVGFLDSPR